MDGCCGQALGAFRAYPCSSSEPMALKSVGVNTVGLRGCANASAENHEESCASPLLTAAVAPGD